MKRVSRSHKLLRNLTSRNLKSQAALEFLTTYAWAFLVIIVMIGALAYFGILKPSKILPDRCTFGTEITCVDFRVGYGTTGSDGTFDIRLKNSIGEPIVIPAVEADINLSTESFTPFLCTLNSITGSGVTGSFTWETGDIIDISFNNCNPAAIGFSKGDKAKVLIAIRYHLAKTSPTYLREVSGEVFTTVT
ncbi:hypothetical protein HYU50_01100 [Candidatus Woesearchaeota archaeon]|nr:hypothetical protein [Candidatus Woesearchaeota archaeon]